MRRRLLQAIPAAIAAPIFFIAGKSVSDSASILTVLATAAVAFVVAVLLYILATEAQEYVVGTQAFPRTLESLRIALNWATRDNVSSGERDNADLERTTIGKYARHEDRLGNGDIAYVLTHDLYIYDCIPAALDVIARNLLQGVRYKYYLAPNAVGRMCQFFCDKLLERLENVIREEGGLENSVVRNRLFQAAHRIDFRKVRGPLLYPFSITDRQGQWADAHWYAAKPAAGEDENVELTVLYFRAGERSDALIALFATLRSWRHSSSIDGLVDRLEVTRGESQER